MSIERFMDAVLAAELDEHQKEFVTKLLWVLALRMSKMDPAEQKRTLKKIEDNGALLGTALRLLNPAGTA